MKHSKGGVSDFMLFDDTDKLQCYISTDDNKSLS